MLSGRVAAESQLCVMSPNKWSDQNEYVTYINVSANDTLKTYLNLVILLEPCLLQPCFSPRRGKEHNLR